MGFFGLDITAPSQGNKPIKKQGGGISVELLHKSGCKLCPLNRATGVKSGKMEAVGSEEPLIYILGAGPDKAADNKNTPFAGEQMQFIRSHMPREIRDQLRFNNVVRSHPGMVPNKEHPKPESILKLPDFTAIECCRPSIVTDIEQTQPRAIFGFGPIPLKWALNETHPFHWLGRRAPVRIGSHTCWYYAFPAIHEIIKDRKWDNHVPDSESFVERVMWQAVEQLLSEDDPEPEIHSLKRVRENVEWVTGENGDADLRVIERHLRDCTDAKYVGLDYETNALRPYNDGQAFLLTAALAIEDKSLAFPFEHKQAKWSGKQLDKLETMYREFLLTKGPTKISHQLGFELEWSAALFGKDTIRAAAWGDSLAQAYVINETQGMLALEVLTTQYYGFNIKELSPVNRRRLDDEQLTAVLEYNAIDAKYHRELFITQKPLLQEQGMVPVYDHTVRRIATLVLTQMRGVPVDQDEVAAFRKRYESEAKKWFDKIAELPDVQAFRKHAGHDFEPTNNHDVVKLLKQLGMPSAKSDEKVLSKIDHPVASLILKHRKVSKLLSTYVLPVSEEHTNYLGQVVPRSEHLFSDNLLHPIISTTKVRTWRTSSEDPNVQNWPKRGPNFEIRRVVKPERGFKVLAFDYAGIQARNIAMESLDETLTQSFITGYDIHSDYVEQILKRHPKWMGGGKLLHKDEKLFKTARHKAKNGFVFPSFFGAKPTSISVGILDAPKDVVEDLQEYLWDMFPDIHKWQAKLQKFYKREGYITGLSGHRRHAPCSYNELINAPIQADESLIVLTAMSELSELDYKRYQPIMEIHDDLTFVCPAKKVDEYADVIIREMVKPRFDWIDPVPLVVEMSVGDDWANLVHVGDFENVGTKGYREINKK